MKGTFWFFYGLAFTLWAAVWLGYDIGTHHWSGVLLQGAFGVFFCSILVGRFLHVLHAHTTVRRVTEVNVDLDPVVEALNKIIRSK